MASLFARVDPSPSISPSRSRVFSWRRAAFVPLLAAVLAGLFAPADAGAEVRRRLFIPSASGVSEVWLPYTLGAEPGYSSSTPRVLAFSPDGAKMYGVEPISGNLLVYGLTGNSPPTVIPLNLTDALSMVVTPDGKKAYVARNLTDIAIVNLATMTLGAPMTSPNAALRLALSPDGASLYAVSAPALMKFSTATDTYVSQVGPFVGNARSVAITPDGLRALVIDSAARVTDVDLTAFTSTGTETPTGGDLRNIVITPDSGTALIADYQGRVLFYNVATCDVETTDDDLTYLDALGSIDIEEDGKHVWIYDSNVQVVMSIDVATRTVVSNEAVSGLDIDGKFIARPAFVNTGPADAFATDAELTALGFANDVIVQGPIDIAAGFTTSRKFYFTNTPEVHVTSGTVTFDGPLLGQGFNPSSPSNGTLVTTGTNSLTGGMFVTNLTLQVDGTHTGPITIDANAILTGTGTIDSHVNVEPGGTVRPAGAGVGILTVTGDVGFETGSKLSLDINGTTAGTGHDRLVAGSAMVREGVTLETTLGYTPTAGDTVVVLTNVLGVAWPFDATTGNGAGYDLGGRNTRVRYDGGTGDDMSIMVDDLPTASTLSNEMINEDGVYNGSINIFDDLTSVSSLTVTATSNQQWLVPDANISVTGITGTRPIQITPVPDMAGTATITLRVSDGLFYAERSFQLTVNSVNDAPTMTAIGPQTTNEDTPKGPIAFDIDDIDGCLFNVTIVATSSNQAIVKDADIVAGGTNAHRTLTITPVANAYGTVTITVRAYDDNDYTEQTFQLTVTPTPDPPSISPIANQTIAQNGSTGPIAFTITDADGFADHVVTATSGYQPLVPNANLVIGGADGARTLTITPLAGQHGTSIVTVWVNDGGTPVSTSFMLTVNAAPEPEPEPEPEPTPAITYALAEGATGMFFNTDLLLANPNAVAAPVTITWMLEGGGTINDSRVLPPMSRTTIKVDEVAGLESTTFSTQVVSTEGHPIAVERTMRWGAGGYGAHTEKAGDSGATTWYFAEGASGWFSTYLLLGNPQSTANTAHVEWLREGEPVLTRDYPLLPRSRTTIDTREDAELRDRAFGAKVTFDQPGVAERTMYFGESPLWTGGGAAAGQTSLATRWDFAEGATGTYFTTFLLLANPGTQPADITLTFYPQGGTPVTITDTLAAGQRMTRNIALEHPSLANASMASHVESTQPIVAERAQYWGAPEWIESHNSFGVTTPGKRWALAEGRVGGDDSAQTYILLSNPGATAATATLTFLRTDGTTLAKSVDVPAASRVTFGVTGPDGAAPELVNEAFGTLIESTKPIIVERSLYINANDVIWAAGTNATATVLPEPQ